jgi:hypothetical protein
MGNRQVLRVVGVLVWATFFLLFLATRNQVFMILSVVAIIGQVVTSVSVGRQ